MLCAGFGEHQRTVGKIEGCQISAARQLCFRCAPMQPACDHQVKHQPEIVLEHRLRYACRCAAIRARYGPPRRAMRRL